MYVVPPIRSSRRPACDAARAYQEGWHHVPCAHIGQPAQGRGWEVSGDNNDEPEPDGDREGHQGHPKQNPFGEWQANMRVGASGRATVDSDVGNGRVGCRPEGGIPEAFKPAHGSGAALGKRTWNAVFVALPMATGVYVSTSQTGGSPRRAQLRSRTEVGGGWQVKFSTATQRCSTSDRRHASIRRYDILDHTRLAVP
jgi:hypothetical protein